MSARSKKTKRLRTSLRIKMFQSRRSDSDPIGGMNYHGMSNMNGRVKSYPPAQDDSGIESNNDLKNIIVPSIQIPRMSQDVINSAPPSPGGKGSHNNPNVRLNNLLGIPESGSVGNVSPKPLRRSLSARGPLEFHPGSASPRMRKRPPSLIMGPEFYGDSISAINVPVGNSEPHRPISEERALSILMSSIYAVFLIMLGVIIFINDQHRDHRLYSEIFSSIIFAIGILWLVVFHVDLCLYKTEVLKQLKEREDAMQEANDRFSTATEFIINSGFDFSTTQNKNNDKDYKPPPYRFLMGRHSGSFYLKIGSAGFCFGYLIYQGLQLGQHILTYVNEEDQTNCSNTSSVILHVLSPIYAFYQLFITFKYSNIVINRHIVLARFGLMHLIAACMCNWFGTIVEEAVEDYSHRRTLNSSEVPTSEFNIASFNILVTKRENWNDPYHCTAESVLSTRSLSAIPYLYPFAIEFNLLLAGVWFIVWQNIGTEHSHSNPHHLRHTISQDELGSDEITYQSNLVINADCHSANKGLFTGLFLLLTTIVTVIVFFVAMSTKGYEPQAVIIHTVQEGGLTMIGMLAVIVAFYQIRKLDLSEHPITFLDDVLLFVPLPFYFIHGIMSVMAEYSNENYSRLALHILVTIQVIVQTPFIIDGLRRCSNSQSLRYKKPGREIITFLIILNLTLWIVNTFELKSVEHYHGQEEYFGDLIWMFIGHTTLPLMLFYRFHSSVCLADMWKSAYEKETSQG
ncbi:proton channel OtopLc-like isoform X2 [Argiope bruennichi]|uniref:Proton channel OtopLc like protein n=1 Tax=Argiope bruennichi TaxID=94029 RepID=A0A8T0FM95_ARGBR|nr:proton channel OtopLc-like isoform X2 [Argiope bruennichi]KAF8790530.1 Proton channel OtopLc like protein [Argiope bruennichi]